MTVLFCQIYFLRIKNEKPIKQVVPSEISGMNIDIESFIALYNDKKWELIDIREPFEPKVWQMNFGLQIPVIDLGVS